MNRDITKICRLLYDLLEDNDDIQEDIPLDNIPSKYLRDIIEYCEHYNFEKVSEIPQPLTSTNLTHEIKDPYEVGFITKYQLEEVL